MSWERKKRNGFLPTSDEKSSSTTSVRSTVPGGRKVPTLPPVTVTNTTIDGKPGLKIKINIP